MKRGLTLKTSLGSREFSQKKFNWKRFGTIGLLVLATTNPFPKEAQFLESITSGTFRGYETLGGTHENGKDFINIYGKNGLGMISVIRNKNGKFDSNSKISYRNGGFDSNLLDCLNPDCFELAYEKTIGRK